MKLKRIFLILILGMIMLVLRAQCDQRGEIIAFDGEKRTPLAGVSIVVEGASSVISDQNGHFTLHFNTMNAGDRIKVLSINKIGYAVFNSNSLNHWLLSSNIRQTFTIVMSPIERMKEIRDNYMCQLSDNYRQQHQAYLDSIQSNHQQLARALQRMRDTIAYRQQLYAEQLLVIDEYAKLRSNLSSVSEEVARIRNLIEEKEAAVRTARAKILDRMILFTHSKDKALWMKADSIYAALYTRYAYDMELRQQYADHLYVTATADKQLDRARLTRCTEPLVGIILNKEISPVAEARARLSLILVLIKLRQAKASEEQFKTLLPLLEPLFQSNREFYHEALQRSEINPRFADYDHPTLPFLVQFSAHFTNMGCWDTGIQLLNDAYNMTEKPEIRASIQEQMATWGLLPDALITFENE